MNGCNSVTNDLVIAPAKANEQTEYSRAIFNICWMGANKTFWQGFSECVTKNLFSYFSTKSYVVGTQKNRLNETVLLSTQNIYVKNDG